MRLLYLRRVARLPSGPNYFWGIVRSRIVVI